MEFTNPDKKPLKEILEMAEKDNMTIVIIGAGEAGTLVERVINNSKLLAIRIENINPEDQERLSQTKKKENPFEPPPIPIKNYRMDMPEVVLRNDDLNKKWYDNVPKRKKKKRF